MEKKPEDNKEKKEKMTYEPPELIDLAGEGVRGFCSPVGSADVAGCVSGTAASFSCVSGTGFA